MIPARMQTSEMDLDKESIEEFKRIWKAEFREDISDEDARRIAHQLLELYRVLYLESEGWQ